MESPDKFRFSTTQSERMVNLLWWELFDDPVLHSLVYQALDHNRNLRIAASRMEEARAVLGYTRADMYPKLDIEASATRGNLAGRSKLESDQNSFFIGPVLNWEIDFWGKFRRSNEAAQSELIASQYGLRTVEISLISEVVSTYFLLMDLNQRLRVSENTLKSRIDSMHIIGQRFEKGIIPEIDLNQAQIQKEIAAAAIPAYERLIAKTENVLSILVGRIPGEILKGKSLDTNSNPPEIPSGIPSELMRRRPDVLQAEYSVKAQNARIGIAQAMRFPSISLTGVVGLASDDLSTLISDGSAWSVGGSLFGPLFHFNKNIRRVDIEKERTKQAILRYENTVLLALKEVEDALIEIDTYKRQVGAVVNKLHAARNAAALSKERYDKGVASYLEVLDTERTLFDVELELSELRQLYLNAYVKLYKSLGGGWISEKEKDFIETLSSSDRPAQKK